MKVNLYVCLYHVVNFNTSIYILSAKHCSSPTLPTHYMLCEWMNEWINTSNCFLSLLKITLLLPTLIFCLVWWKRLVSGQLFLHWDVKTVLSLISWKVIVLPIKCTQESHCPSCWISSLQFSLLCLTVCSSRLEAKPYLSWLYNPQNFTHILNSIVETSFSPWLLEKFCKCLDN